MMLYSIMCVANMIGESRIYIVAICNFTTAIYLSLRLTNSKFRH